jgi:hypothetical protein
MDVIVMCEAASRRAPFAHAVRHNTLSQAGAAPYYEGTRKAQPLPRAAECHAEDRAIGQFVLVAIVAPPRGVRVVHDARVS